MRKNWLIATALWLLLCSVPLGSAVAQEKNGPEGTPTDEPQSASSIAVPSNDQIVALVCSTLISLNQANLTGNYSVFRELGAPGFQVVNSSGQLAETFAELRDRNFDLSPIIRMHPKLVQAPAIEPNGMLRVTGFFATQPERLNFDLIFQTVNDRWRLFGLGVNTSPVEDAGPEPQMSKAPIAEATENQSAVAAVATGGGVKKPVSGEKREQPSAANGSERLKIETEGAASASREDKNSFNPFAWFR
ncbi:hypothetical protein [Methyloceanibacter sp. wino2]|uniref:hypothetical protein n=1 Tax=Methyloceanibacter sp. wino2 TaxID=2170729 RepID=UPI00131EF596|nr:hypothetical protein [Methyloceanibacter sp. wino2]